MDDPRYEGRLFGDLSAVFQRNRDLELTEDSRRSAWRAAFRWHPEVKPLAAMRATKSH
jgi:hypothetical protein